MTRLGAGHWATVDRPEAGPLGRWLGRLVAHPRVYDLCQLAVGATSVNRRAASALAAAGPEARILDAGGGTGLASELLPAGCGYVCLDLDPQKLRGLRPGRRRTAVQGDVTGMPFASGSFDAVLIKLVAHHLPDPALGGLLGEAVRVLRPGGLLVLVDAVWAPRRVLGRLLWRYDRGAHPRPAADLRRALAARLAVSGCETWDLLHKYALCYGLRPQGAAVGGLGTSE